MQINAKPFPDSPLLRRWRLVALPVAVIGALAAIVAASAELAGRPVVTVALVVSGIAGALSTAALVFFFRERFALDRAASALENAEARMGGLVESALDAIITIDEDQRIIQFNDAAERVFLWQRAAVIGKPLEILIPDRLREAHRGHIERFATTSVTSRAMGVQTVLQGLRANGAEFPIEASISQHIENGKKRFSVILRDVSLRLSGEAALAQSEARMRGILDSAMDAIITVDERQRIVLFNATAEEVFGCPREDAIGSHLSWFMPARFRAGHGALIERFGSDEAASRRMGKARVVMGLRRSGEEFPIEASISQTVEGEHRFFTVILRDVTERVRGDEALRGSKEEIRRLALAANDAREQEKRRIARELHDELGQSLTALKMDVVSLRESFPSADDATTVKLDSMRKLLDSTVAAARRISSDLRPMMLDDLGLVAAAGWLAQDFAKRTAIPCEFVVSEGTDLDLPDPYATALFRVLQESLTNVAKHAEATQVEATLERVDGEAILIVRDNGKGMAPAATKKIGSFGLTGLRERAYLLGGTLKVDSSPDTGTQIEFRVPIPEPTPAPTA